MSECDGQRTVVDVVGTGLNDWRLTLHGEGETGEIVSRVVDTRAGGIGVLGNLDGKGKGVGWSMQELRELGGRGN